jgi:hypothetical protein
MSADARQMFTVCCFKRLCKGDRRHPGAKRANIQVQTSKYTGVEDNVSPSAEEETRREAQRAKARARAAAYHKANAEKRAAAAVARRLAMSDAERMVRNQRSKKWRDDNKEKYREIARRSRAKKRADKTTLD